MNEREKLAKELVELVDTKENYLEDEYLVIADFILARDKRIVEPLKYTLEKFDSIHTKIERQSYSFVMANDIRRVLTNAGISPKREG